MKELPKEASVGWLKINAANMKSALATWVAKWTNAHTQYLHKYITSELANLESFIKAVNKGLTLEVDADDTSNLVAAMTHVRDVRVNTEKIDRIFGPLRDSINLLKKFEIHMPEEVIDQVSATTPVPPPL